jgi:hypothetical protein
MSAREMIRRDLDLMPDDVVSVFSSMWVIMKKNLEIPNQETRQAYEDAVNDNYTHSFDSAEDLITYIHSIGEEDAEL